jgi:hypothetical protein
MTEEEQQVQRRKVPGFIKPLLMVLIPLLIGGAIVALMAKQNPQILGLSKGTAQLQAENDSLVAEVGKLIVLPSDEKPTIATVTDAEKIKDQSFFKNAKNGDKIIIYTGTKKAILYRPSEKRIIEVGAVNINQQGQTEIPTVSPSPVATPTVAPTVAPTPVPAE